MQDFKDRSAQDAITRRDAMAPKRFTDAEIKQKMVDAGFQNVNGRMVAGDQADHIQKRMGLPGEQIDKGAMAFQQRNKHGVLTDPNGNPMPAHLETNLTKNIGQGPEALNPFSPVETPMLTRGVKEGRVVRGNPAGVPQVGPDGKPSMGPSTDPPFMPAPGTAHQFPTFTANQDNRNFTPTQLTDGNNWTVPTRTPTQTAQPTSIPQGGIPGIGQPQNAPAGAPPAGNPNMNNPLPATAPQNMWNPQGETEEEKKKKRQGFMQGIFG